MKDSTATIPNVTWSRDNSNVALSSTTSTSGSNITVSAQGYHGTTSLTASAGGVSSSTLDIYLWAIYLDGQFNTYYTSDSNPGSYFKTCGGYVDATDYYCIPNWYYTYNGNNYYVIRMKYCTYKGTVYGCYGCGFDTHEYWYMK